MNAVNSTAGCNCDATPKLIFACSGAADVGQVADLAARRLNAEGLGRMFCLSGVGGRVSGIMATTQAAQSIVAIDGCSLDYTRRTLEEAGFHQFVHVWISDLGLEKGQTPATAENINEVVAVARTALAV